MKNKPNNQGNPVNAIIVAISIAAVVFIIFRLINAGSEISNSISQTKPPETHMVRYQIKCESCSVTYATRSGIEQVDEVNSDWSFTYEANRFTAASITAQNKNEIGDVMVAIFVNGKMIEYSQSSGAYVIATANLFLE